MDWIRLIQDALLITGITLGASLMGGSLFSEDKGKCVSSGSGESGTASSGSGESGTVCSGEENGTASSGSGENGIPGGGSQRSRKNRIYLVGAHALCILYTIARVFFCYQGQENSDYFFWHPYLAWLWADLAWILMHRTTPLKRLLPERLLLWPFVVIPVFSGIALCFGWLLKLYLRYFLPYKIY